MSTSVIMSLIMTLLVFQCGRQRRRHLPAHGAVGVDAALLAPRRGDDRQEGLGAVLDPSFATQLQPDVLGEKILEPPLRPPAKRLAL